MEKQKKTEAAHEMGLFDCLPDELFQSILNRLHDLKCLCRCTLVSKPFASRIYRIKSVSLKLPSFDVSSHEAYCNLYHLFRGMFRFEGQELPKLIPQPSLNQKLKFTTFLQNFKELESVYFESACPRTPCTTPFLKWKAKLGTSGPALDCLVSLLPIKMFEEAENDPDEEEFENREGIFDFLEFPAKNCLLFPLVCFTEWLVLVFSLIKSHHCLRSVTCTDEDKHGTFVLRDEQIGDWRRRLMNDELSGDTSPRTVNMGWVPELCLPVSGYRMKGVFFAFMSFIAGPGVPSFEEELVTWEFDQGEEKVLGEAMKEILKSDTGTVMWEVHPW